MEKHDERTTNTALANVAQLVGCCPASQKVAGSIPGQGTCLVCGFHPQLGRMQEATDQRFSLTSMCLSLSVSLPSPLSRTNKWKNHKRMTNVIANKCIKILNAVN